MVSVVTQDSAAFQAIQGLVVYLAIQASAVFLDLVVGRASQATPVSVEYLVTQALVASVDTLVGQE